MEEPSTSTSLRAFRGTAAFLDYPSDKGVTDLTAFTWKEIGYRWRWLTPHFQGVGHKTNGINQLCLWDDYD